MSGGRHELFAKAPRVPRQSRDYLGRHGRDIYSHHVRTGAGIRLGPYIKHMAPYLRPLFGVRVIQLGNPNPSVAGADRTLPIVVNGYRTIADRTMLGEAGHCHSRRVDNPALSPATVALSRLIARWAVQWV